MYCRTFARGVVIGLAALAFGAPQDSFAVDHVCMLVKFGPAGPGLWAYYAASWQSGVCGANPHLYYHDENLTSPGCASDIDGDGDPDPMAGAQFCLDVDVEVAKDKVEVAKDKVKDKGCEKGIKGNLPPKFVSDNTHTEFNAKYKIGNNLYRIKFYLAHLPMGDGTVFLAAVAFQARDDEFTSQVFQSRDPKTDNFQVDPAGSKCFYATVNGTTYRGLLR
jgi:hypothetical protein